jgi:uncharacterized protein (DUF2237 family)
MSYSAFPELKSKKLKRILKSNGMKWDGMKSTGTSALNLTLICDIETNYFLKFRAETLNDRYLLTASKILWSENLDIKLNSDCDSNN